MRTIFVLIFVFIGSCLCAQKETIPITENFSIEGKVKKGLVVSLEDLSSCKSPWFLQKIK